MGERSICADLGRCAYAVADDVHGDGTTEDGCTFWSDCFGAVVPPRRIRPKHVDCLYTGRLCEKCRGAVSDG